MAYTHLGNWANSCLLILTWDVTPVLYKNQSGIIKSNQFNKNASKLEAF